MQKTPEFGLELKFLVGQKNTTSRLNFSMKIEILKTTIKKRQKS